MSVFRPILDAVAGPSATSLFWRRDRLRVLAMAWRYALSAELNLFSSKFSEVARKQSLNRRVLALLVSNTMYHVFVLGFLSFMIADLFHDWHIKHYVTLLVIATPIIVLGIIDYKLAPEREVLNSALDIISDRATGPKSASRAFGIPSAPTSEELMKRNSRYDAQTTERILKSVREGKGKEAERLAQSRKAIEEAFEASPVAAHLELSTFDPKRDRP